MILDVPEFIPRDYQSAQERLAHIFVAQSLGYAESFVPSNYGKSKEPADLVYIHNRLAVLFYCQESKASPNDKIGHNLSQGRWWVRQWASGHVLHASNSHAAVDKSFDDIDDVLIISVIDGESVGITRFEVRPHYLRLKVIGEFSIGFDLLRQLMSQGANICDFLDLLSEVPIGSSIPRQLVETSVAAQIGRVIAAGLAQFEFAHCEAQHDVPRIIDVFRTAKMAEGGHQLARFSASALGIAELSFFAAGLHIADRTIGRTLPTTEGPGVLGLTRRLSGITLGVFVAANARLFGEHLSEFSAKLPKKQYVALCAFYFGAANEVLTPLVIGLAKDWRDVRDRLIRIRSRIKPAR